MSEPPDPYRVVSVHYDGPSVRLKLDNHVDVPDSEPALLYKKDGLTWLHWRGLDVCIEDLNFSTPDYSTLRHVDLDILITVTVE